MNQKNPFLTRIKNGLLFVKPNRDTPQTADRKNKMARHPLPLTWFIQERETIHDFVTREVEAAIASGKRHLLAKAPVKAGKREIVECIAVAFRDSKVFYTTSLNRKDVARQKLELDMYGVSTHLIDSATKSSIAIACIERVISSGKIAIICFDECDYGSGTNQKMAGLYRKFVDDDRVVKIYFSASAHETEASKLRDRGDYVCLTYTPPPEYCGAKFFLDNDLVSREVDTFFEKDDDGNISISQHAHLVIQESINANRHIGGVRLSRGISTRDLKSRVVKEDIQRQLQNASGDGKEWRIVPVDQTDSHDWEDSDIARRYTNDTAVNYLFVFVQTCTRGTDLKGWHHRLAFWHDSRSKKDSDLNTLIQAFLRPSHYSTCYGGVPQHVRLYVDYVVVEMAAYDDMDAYLRAGGRAPTRTKLYIAPDYEVSKATFESAEEARDWASRYGNVSEFHLGEDNCFAYRGKRRRIQSEEQTRSSSDLGWGVASSNRIMPVLTEDDEVAYIVIFRDNDDDDEEDDAPRKAVETTRKSMYS